MEVLISDYFVKEITAPLCKPDAIGVKIAANELFKNLLLRGTLDEYHFFVLAKAKSKISEFVFNEHRRVLLNKRVYLHPRAELPSFLQNHNNLVFLIPDEKLFRVAGMRNLFAQRYFPICGLSHDISRVALLQWLFLQNCIADIKRFDTNICASRAAFNSLGNIYRYIKQDLAGQNNLYHKGRLDLLPFGVESKSFSLYNKRSSRLRWKFPQDKLLILFLGRFSLYNKADLYPLLLVFRRLLSVHKDIILVLAGNNISPDSYSYKVEQMAREMGLMKQVRFVYHIARGKDLGSLYSACDIFVSFADSLTESFGLVVIEAMASGLPVVVSDWGGYRDTVVHKHTGFRVPAYWARCDQGTAHSTYLYENDIVHEMLSSSQSVCIDVEKMQQYLALLIVNKELRESFGRNARLHAQKNFDWGVLIPRYERLWRQQIREAKLYKKSPKKEPPLHPRYFDCFQDFPSQKINHVTLFKITEDGERLLREQKLASGFPEVRFFMPKVIFLILMHLKEMAASSPGEVYAFIRGFFRDINLERVSYHIMWMLKYDLITLVKKE